MEFAANRDTDYASLKELVNGLDISILVNNVGQSHSIPVPFSETPEDEVQGNHHDQLHWYSTCHSARHTWHDSAKAWSDLDYGVFRWYHAYTTSGYIQWQQSFLAAVVFRFEF